MGTSKWENLKNASENKTKGLLKLMRNFPLPSKAVEENQSHEASYMGKESMTMIL